MSLLPQPTSTLPDRGSWQFARNLVNSAVPPVEEVLAEERPLFVACQAVALPRFGLNPYFASEGMQGAYGFNLYPPLAQVGRRTRGGPGPAIGGDRKAIASTRVQ